MGTAVAIVAVVAAERVAELNREGLRSALERRELTSRKQILGVGTGLDVVRADQDVSTARDAIVTGDESLRQAREALGLALGLPEQVGVAKDISVDGVAQQAERSCPKLDKLDQRADILSDIKNVELAERNITNFDLNFLPTVGLQSQFATTTADLGGSALRSSLSVTGVLSIPIWDGGARYGSLRNARALRDEAQYTLEAARRTETLQVEQARRSITVAEASLDVARQTQQLAAKVDQLTQTAYRAGQGTSLELVVAASALRAARDHPRDPRVQRRHSSSQRAVRARQMLRKRHEEEAHRMVGHAGGPGGPRLRGVALPEGPRRAGTSCGRPRPSRRRRSPPRSRRAGPCPRP